MKIAVWQTGSADLGQLRQRAREAAGAGARLLFKPAAVTSGYAVPGIAGQAPGVGDVDEHGEVHVAAHHDPA